MKYVFTLADYSVLKEVYILIDARISWMDKAGIKQWNVRNYWKVYPKSYYKSKVEQKQLYVLKRTDNNKVVGAIVLLETDELWNDCKEVSAYYLHNFVTDCSEKGVGSIILTFVEELAMTNRKKFIRLDCAIDNASLNTYYENQGFILCGQCVDGIYIGKKNENKI